MPSAAKIIKIFCIIPIVLQKFALPMKNAENLDTKELLEVPLIKCVIKNHPCHGNFSDIIHVDIIIAQIR
jgi:hypothetical protein